MGWVSVCTGNDVIKNHNDAHTPYLVFRVLFRNWIRLQIVVDVYGTTVCVHTRTRSLSADQRVMPPVVSRRIPVPPGWRREVKEGRVHYFR